MVCRLSVELIRGWGGFYPSFEGHHSTPSDVQKGLAGPCRMQSLWLSHAATERSCPGELRQLCSPIRRSVNPEKSLTGLPNFSRRTLFVLGLPLEGHDKYHVTSVGDHGEGSYSRRIQVSIRSAGIGRSTLTLSKKYSEPTTHPFGVKWYSTLKSSPAIRHTPVENPPLV